MSDDPINALVSTLLAEVSLPPDLDVIILALDAGITLAHNPHPWVVRDGTERIKPGHTVVRRNGMSVGFVNPWRWNLTIDDDRVRYALHRAIARAQDGLAIDVPASVS